MTGPRFTIRDDDRFHVVVGWNDELESFVLRVWDAGEQVVAFGDQPHEVPTLSDLLSRTGPYARIDVAVQSELRHAARPLSDQAQYPDPSGLLADDASVRQD
jgi:hypothetical protein